MTGITEQEYNYGIRCERGICATCPQASYCYQFEATYYSDKFKKQKKQEEEQKEEQKDILQKYELATVLGVLQSLDITMMNILSDIKDNKEHGFDVESLANFVFYSVNSSINKLEKMLK